MTRLTTAKDSRNLLRRGAVQGFAETDFRGVDGVKYRARWEVRRARLRPAGALQLVRRTLFRVDAAPPVPIADGEKDVTAAVTKLLGLSFDQFRKAVLLAQGDFAAFLRASDQERADLLEKITGAYMNTRVSKKAWEKGRDSPAPWRRSRRGSRASCPWTTGSAGPGRGRRRACASPSTRWRSAAEGCTPRGEWRGRRPTARARLSAPPVASP